ncbi:MAG: hypothetical protein Harvfovirus2_59 [Harvfovirus sp.]|uniref:Uncharacterized protein n=1 Tax=Harvfovirus sp. TaxID=2487768 RepID=A0A3G5A4X6_9VIRU|nr:MAG: hypothetical protein Harvfovirus2_59 [Harvfovirus sp.]
MNQWDLLEEWDLDEQTSTDVTEDELKNWSKFVFLDKSNVIRLTDEGCKLFNRGGFTSVSDVRGKKVILALVQKQRTVAANQIPVLRYDPITISRRLLMPFEKRIFPECEGYGWLNDHLSDDEMFKFKLEQASYWENYVVFDEKTRKVRLTVLGERVLLGKKKMPVHELIIFREMIAVLLMKKFTRLLLNDKSRMESVELSGECSSVRALSVELVAPRIINKCGRSPIMMEAVIRFCPLFYKKKS